ncbi:MAG: hypothetical protein IPH20_04885 [Bacteroidales bacterium]|nr:hypothetical protein [Bacteroidales bacterium]
MMKIPLIGILPQSILAFWELISQGAIMSSAKDDDVQVTLKGYITGDIQVFIIQRKGKLNEDLLAQTNLQGIGEEATAMFRSKFFSLKALPIFLLFLLNSGGLYAYYHYIYQQIRIQLPFIEPGNVNPDLPHLLILIFPLVSVFFNQSIGNLVLKSLIEVISWFQSLGNFITGRKKA